MKALTISVSEERMKQGIMMIYLNNPEQLNAMNRLMMKELNQALDDMADSESIKAVILTSSSKKAFCTGIDVKEVKGLSNDEAASFFEDLASLLDKIINFPVPVLAAVSGYAYGAGADLALACDIRIGEPSSSYRFPGPQFGVVLGTRRLITELGASRARFLALTNEQIDAQQALEYGLIHDIAEKGSLVECALERVKVLTGLHAFTFQTISALSACWDSNKSAGELARLSVTDGDFQERFNRYLNKAKAKKTR